MRVSAFLGVNWYHRPVIWISQACTLPGSLSGGFECHSCVINEITFVCFWRHMVNAVVPLGEKPNTYGWLQLEKKAAQSFKSSSKPLQRPPAPSCTWSTT